MLSHQSRSAPCGGIMRTDVLQVVQYPAHIIISQRDVFHVHHRLGKTAVREHVADIVHVGEVIQMIVTIHTIECQP